MEKKGATDGASGPKVPPSPWRCALPQSPPAEGGGWGPASCRCRRLATCWANWREVPPSPRPSPPGEGEGGAAVGSRGPKAALVPHPVTVVGHGRRRPSVLGQARKEAEAKRWSVGWSGNSLSWGRGQG